MNLGTVEDLGLMQKSIAKLKEAVDVLHEHGIVVHKVTEVNTLAENFCTATLVINLDFRKECRE